MVQPVGASVFHPRPISIDDFDTGCPVSVDALGRIYRAEGEALDQLLAAISETTRARLAVYLYGRSHTHELGVRVAATCDAVTMKRTSGALGEAIHAQSRQNYVRPTYGEERRSSLKRISLGGSAMTGAHFA